MQIKVFSIPLMGGEIVNEEMNVFLRSKRILQVESKLVTVGETPIWSFCVRYLEENQGKSLTPPFLHRETKVDYQATLDKPSAERFTALRTVRRDLSKADGIPAYAIFTDEQLSQLAQIEELTLAKMRSVKGIGEKTVEKYGKHFIITPDQAT
jgi:superfamily II DNA helicase RecQ